MAYFTNSIRVSNIRHSDSNYIMVYNLKENAHKKEMVVLKRMIFQKIIEYTANYFFIMSIFSNN